MTPFNDNPDLWPMLLLLVLLGVAVFAAMMATNRAEQYKEQSYDLQRRLEAQEEITRQRDSQIILAEGKASAHLQAFNDASAEAKRLKEEKGNLTIQVKALCKDIESLRAFNGDMHRVIDMDAQKLKEKDRLLAQQQEKIDRLMKIRKK